MKKQSKPVTEGAGRKSAVGNETKADMEGAFHGQPTDKNALHGAIQGLEAEHPIRYDDHGPHHGTDHHIRHNPLHGLKPTGKYTR